MATTIDFRNYVLEQLSTLEGVTSRRMFGGVGLYCEGVFFGLIAEDVLYFKVGDETRGDYESRGMAPFRPFSDRPDVSTSYFEVPAEVLEDGEECGMWARRSVAAASAAKSVRGRPAARRRRARAGKR
jgi:DNA transformation protein